MKTFSRFSPGRAVFFLVLALALVSMGAARAQNIFTSNYYGEVGDYDVSGGPVVSNSSNDDYIYTGGSPYNLLLSGDNLYVSNFSTDVVTEYNASTAAQDNSFSMTATGGELEGIGLYGGNLYVANFETGDINIYNDSTGALVTTNYITGLSDPAGLVISGNDLYVVNATGTTSVSAFNISAGTGAGTATALPGFSLTGVVSPGGLAISGGTLYIATEASAGNGNGYISTYNASNGNLITSQYMTAGLMHPQQITISGNDLYASDAGNGTVEEYDLSTGDQVGGAALVTGVIEPYGIAVEAVPEPPVWALLAGALLLIRLARRDVLRRPAR